ncbi:MAG TPA: malto-oligosyltrehalose synthase, partial [Sunxiuqinia sp.]|nr:malto-oligosyltrehalose synthase [Sunxiuqinia sp.]
FHHYFDILQDHPDKKLSDRLMLPFFGKHLEQLINDEELKIGFDQQGFSLNYYDNKYPVSVPGYPFILGGNSKADSPLFISEFSKRANFYDQFDEWKKRLWDEYSELPEIKIYIDDCLAVVNNNSAKLKELIDKLHYFPSFWKDTEEKINYRRFFTINGLICINVQHGDVFKKTHRSIERWIRQHKFNGLRVDHIDGLFNPTEYLDSLRELAGEKTYTVVEKILEKDEKLPENWPIEGSTGYDFLALANNLLTNPEKGSEFYSYYKEWIDQNKDFDTVFYQKNRFILYHRLKGELDNLTRECLSIQSFLQLGQDGKAVKSGIGEFLIFCPVYKIYNSPSRFSEQEKNKIRDIVGEAIKKNPTNERALVALLDLFLLKLEGSHHETAKIDRFFRHCMQFTGPLMAKGIEDTAFYSYNPFICHNEVGDSPGYFGIRTQQFHQYMQERLEKQPLTMNAISTHDTKRGEDARARLNVLSDIPEQWMGTTRQWRKMNRKFKLFDGDQEIPTPNDEYFIYQALCAHLPMNAEIDSNFVQRLQDYLVKAMREAKENSSWSDPDEYYENETLRFVREIIAPDTKFHDSFKGFMKRIIPHGIVNSISQLILKNTVPGVPDTFQGTENWNLSFVDPDNRRPVNYKQLNDNLSLIINGFEEDAAGFASSCWQQPIDGQVKQWITWLTLQERSQSENLFLKGNYQPLNVSGDNATHVIAFYRHYRTEHLVIALPLNTARLSEGQDWGNTSVEFPDEAPEQWENRLTKTMVEITTGTLQVDSLFEILPFAVLRNIGV